MNSNSVAYCKQCQFHWKQVWKKPRGRSKSQKKPQANNPKQQQRQVQEQQEEDFNMNLFQDKPPWVQSTPNARLNRHGMEKEDNLPLPPPPVLPEPPQVTPQAYTEEDSRLLKTLQDLQKSGMDLSTEQISKMEELEKKSKESEQPKELSHGLLHKKTRVEKQLGTIMTKINTLDAEWQKFTEGIQQKICNHAQMFTQCRQQLVSSYRDKNKELQSIKEEMTIASQHMIGKITEAADLPEAPNVDAQMNQMREVTQREIQVISDDDMEAELIADSQTTPGDKDMPKHGQRRGQAFRGSTSPAKVANQFLKAKTEPKSTWQTWLKLRTISTTARSME